MSGGIVRAGDGDVAAVAGLVAEAFAGLAATAWLVPDPHRRVSALRGQFAILVAHAVRHGHVDLLDDGTAAAVWFDNTRDVPPPDGYDERLRAVAGDAVERFVHLDGLFAAHHPQRPHHHLALLATDKRHQRQGRGTRLVRHHHQVLDSDGVPAYLEASSPGSRDLYARLGYTVAEPFTLPDGTPFWPMWRDPTA